MAAAFITFEGIEGCGKTTQAARSAEFLRQSGMEVILTREPGGTRIGDAIREILLSPKNGEMDPVTELLLYFASRAQHVAEVILPALEAGKVVLCDRFSDATTAYQGYGRGLPLDTIERINTEATGGLAPDLTLLFDLEPEVGLDRVGKRAAASGGGSGDRLEQEELDFHRRVRSGYLEIARREPDRVILVDASPPEAEVAEDVIRVLQEMLRPGKTT